MSSAENDEPRQAVLLKQYEQAWHQVEHLDSSYTQLALIYIALLGAYIANTDKFADNALLISVCLAAVGGCITGAIWRLRKLIDQQMNVIADIENLLDMKRCEPITRGLGKLRTSTYLVVIVGILTALSVFLTFKH